MSNVNITKYYVNLSNWINQTGAVEASQHDHLKVSYRKAAVNIKNIFNKITYNFRAFKLDLNFHFMGTK